MKELRSGLTGCRLTCYYQKRLKISIKSGKIAESLLPKEATPWYDPFIMDMELHNTTSFEDTGAATGRQPQAGQGAAEAPQAAGCGAGAGLPARGRGGFWRQLLGNLGNGVRLSLFLRVDPEAFHATPGDLALLALCDFLFNLATSIFLVGRGGSFAYSAVPGFFFHLPLLLFLGYLAGKMLCRASLAGALPVALVSLSICVELCHSVLERLARLSQLEWLDRYLEAPHYYRFFWWWVAAALVFLLRLTPAPVARRLALLLLGAALIAPLWYYPRADLWVSAAESGGESGELHLTEPVLSAQARLLDGQLAGLLPGEEGEPHLYFVGFAGDGTQDVFLKELLAAEKLFSRRFGTQGRSIVLANNPQTAATLPFASATNLARALARLGQVMNRENDLLVLFLTSHGSREHELAVNNPPLELDQLTPEMVRGMLKKSGIKWRVVIVSACYAGGFIEPLKDDRSLVITAADARSESFGCGYGENFTWFGEALLDQALRKSYSFTAAFENARETIRQWEDEQGETPSNPQLWVGKEIAKKLPALEQELAAGERRGP